MIREIGDGRLFPDRPANTPKGNQWRAAVTDYIPGPDGEYGLAGQFKRDLRTALEWAGFPIRPELFDDSDRTASISIRFHDLRASGVTWRHARRDNPEAICGHEDASTNQIYIRALRGLRPDELFPALPERLLGDIQGNRPDFAQTPKPGTGIIDKIVGAEGFEPPTSTV
jgi:integrase